MKALSHQEKKYGIHGGDEETSIIMALREHWVHKDLLPTEFINFPESTFLAFRNKAFAWIMDDVSVSGISGDASLATPEKGAALIESGSKVLAEALQVIAAFDMKSLISPKDGR